MAESLRRPTVLLVGSRDGSQRTWRAVIDSDERFGTVSEAGSIKDALELLMREYADIVMTEGEFVRASSFDLVDFLASRHPVPVIVETTTCDTQTDFASTGPVTPSLMTQQTLPASLPDHVWRLWKESIRASARTTLGRCVGEPS